MISKKKIGCVAHITVFVILIIGFAAYKYYKKTHIKLTEQYTWKLQLFSDKYNESVIIGPKGKILIGPGIIELWARYPFVYGIIIDDQKTSRFAINLSSNKLLTSTDIEVLRQTDTIEFDFGCLATFQDITGQHCNKQKAKNLLSNMRPETKVYPQNNN